MVNTVKWKADINGEGTIVEREGSYPDLFCPHCNEKLKLKMVERGYGSAIFYCPTKHLDKDYQMSYLTSKSITGLVLEDYTSDMDISSWKNSILDKYKKLFFPKTREFRTWEWLKEKVREYSKDKAKSRYLDRTTTLDKIPKNIFFKCPSASKEVFYFDGNTVQEFDRYTLLGWTLRPSSVAFDRLDPTKTMCTPPNYKRGAYGRSKFWDDLIYEPSVPDSCLGLPKTDLPKTIEEI